MCTFLHPLPGDNNDYMFQFQLQLAMHQPPSFLAHYYKKQGRSLGTRLYIATYNTQPIRMWCLILDGQKVINY